MAIITIISLVIILISVPLIIWNLWRTNHNLKRIDEIHRGIWDYEIRNGLPLKGKPHGD